MTRVGGVQVHRVLGVWVRRLGTLVTTWVNAVDRVLLRLLLFLRRQLGCVLKLLFLLSNAGQTRCSFLEGGLDIGFLSMYHRLGRGQALIEGKVRLHGRIHDGRHLAAQLRNLCGVLLGLAFGLHFLRNLLQIIQHRCRLHQCRHCLVDALLHLLNALRLHEVCRPVVVLGLGFASRLSCCFFFFGVPPFVRVFIPRYCPDSLRFLHRRGVARMQSLVSRLPHLATPTRVLIICIPLCVW
mmetsp:Transcript_26069/g.49234  ORF Transcript_26069/g.49234 Transcript_26069/m.49234 type:complete len:240 (-) Transcript_26069:2938-3657(-)